MISAAIFVAAAGVSWVLTRVILQYARKHAILDQTNSRNSHSVPRLRGRGAAIVLVLYALAEKRAAMQ